MKEVDTLPEAEIRAIETEVMNDPVLLDLCRQVLSAAREITAQAYKAADRRNIDTSSPDYQKHFEAALARMTETSRAVDDMGTPLMNMALRIGLMTGLSAMRRGYELSADLHKKLCNRIYGAAQKKIADFAVDSTGPDGAPGPLQ